MPKSRSSRAATVIGQAAGGGAADYPEDLRDLSDAELSEAMREWEASLEGLNSVEAQAQRQEIAQLLAEYRNNRGDS